MAMRLWVTGLFMSFGAGGGLLLTDDNYLLAAGMGGIIGFVAALIVRTFPRDHDYATQNHESFWRD